MDVSTSKEFIKVYEQISQLQSDITAVAKATYDTPIVSYNEIADTPENLSEFNNDVNFVTGEEVDVKIQSMEPVDLSNCLVKCEVEQQECEVPTTFTELHATTQDEDDSSSYVATTAFVHSVVQQSGEEVTSRIAGTYNNKDYVTKDNVQVMIEDTIGIHDEEVIAGLIDQKIRAAISGIVIPRNLSELINDLGFITSADIPDSSVVSVNGQTGIVQLDIPTVPTNISSFINDAGYITNAGVTSVNNRTGAVQVQENVQADWSATSGLAKILNKPALKRVATTGDYNDLDNIPTIPTNTSDLYNDSGFLTQHQSLAGYALTSQIPTNVSQLTNDAGYLTQHQSLNGYATVESVTAVQQALNSLIGTNDATTVIDSFNEVVSFLNGVTNTETLSGKLLAMQSDIDNSAPFIIDISPNSTSVPSGTYTAAVTALRANRRVVLRVVDEYDNYFYYTATGDTDDIGGVLYFFRHEGIYSSQAMLFSNDSISISPMSNVNINYGNITTSGTVNANAALANRDTLLFADYSASGAVKQTQIAFDGSTTTQALSKKGTWETFAKSSDIPSTGADINYTGSEPYFLAGGITVDGALDMLDSAIGSVGDNAVGRPSSTTDNAIVRFDGTQGNIQNSGVTINDSNHVTAAKFITSGGTNSQVVTGNGTLAKADELPQYEAYLKWGGKNFSNDYSPIDASMIDVLGANRSAFFPGEYVDIEYSRDDGVTWNTYDSLTTPQKTGLFSSGTTIYIGNAQNNDVADEHFQLKIIMNAKGASFYTELNKFAIYLSTSGSTGCWGSIDIRLQKNQEDNVDTWRNIANKVPMVGWSGWNIINTGKFITCANSDSGSTSKYSQIRFTFGCTGYNGNGTTNRGLNIQKIMCFGGVGWSTPSCMAATGHLYRYDSEQTMFVPGNLLPQNSNSYLGGVNYKWQNVYANYFRGNLIGDVTGNVTGTVSSTDRLNIKDTRNINDIPSDFTRGIVSDFKSNTAISGPDNSIYSGIISIKPWTDFSGGKMHQLAFTNNGIYHRKNATDSTWDNWESILTSNSSVGDTNVIETVKVNGTALTPDANKAVDITVPTVPTISTNITTDATDDTKTASPKAVKTYADSVAGDTNVIETVKVNGTALTPDANKAVDVKTHDAVESHGTSDTTFALTPNILHTWGTVTSLTLTLATPSDATIVNEYMFEFESGSTATTLSLPATVEWDADKGDINIESGYIYQVSILNNLALWCRKEVTS